MKRARFSLLSLSICLSYSISRVAWAEDFNAEIVKKYDQLVAPSKNDRPCLNAEEIERVYRLTTYNRVTSFEHIAKYDTPQRSIGYCFGRAVAAHLTARKVGLAQDGIRKVFMIGDLRLKNMDRQGWSFHSATVIRGCNQEYYVIDPLTTRGPGNWTPSTLAQWVQDVRKIFDHNQSSRLFVAPPDTIVPDLERVIVEAPGDNILHVTFQPERHGIQKDESWSKIAKADAYSLSEDLADKYMMTVHEPKKPFNFMKLSVESGQTLDFGKPTEPSIFFLDLVNLFLSGHYAVESERSMVQKPKVAQGLPHRLQDLMPEHQQGEIEIKLEGESSLNPLGSPMIPLTPASQSTVKP